MNAFISIYNNCNQENKCFYAILTNDYRYMYLDIDYKLITPLNQQKKDKLINIIIQALNSFIQLYKSNFGINNYDQQKWIIWDATRLSKFSIHVINFSIIMHHKLNRLFVEKFSLYILNVDKYTIPAECKIDKNIYHTNYQLWRLPGNHNGNFSTVLKLYKNNMHFIEQLKINFMNNIIKNEYSYNKMQTLNNYKQLPEIKHVPKTQTKIDKKIKCGSMNQQTIELDEIEQLIIKKFKTAQIVQKKLLNNIVYFTLKKHHCPIIKRHHKSNTCKIECYNSLYLTKNLAYIKYFCMDEECRTLMPYNYYSLDNILYRPWIFTEILNLNNDIIRELDLFIELLFKHKILVYKNSNIKFQIFKDGKMRDKTVLHNMIISTFLHDNILHGYCKQSNIRIHYKSDSHFQVKKGKPTIYCKKCQIFYNFKKGNIC